MACVEWIPAFAGMIGLRYCEQQGVDCCRARLHTGMSRNERQKERNLVSCPRRRASILATMTAVTANPAALACLNADIDKEG